MVFWDLFGLLSNVSLSLFLLPSMHRKQYLLGLRFVRFLPVKKEALVPLSSWQPLNSVRPEQPAAHVRNKTCTRHWINLYSIIMAATLQDLCWKYIFDLCYNGMCHYCGHLTGTSTESIFSPVTFLWWSFCLLQKLSLATICGLGKEQQQN